MNLFKSILAFFIVTTTITSCKDTANNSAIRNGEIKAGKEMIAALKPETASFKIEGMTCAMGCAKTIETKLSKMNGVQKATVNFDTKQATVEFDATIQTIQQLKSAVETTGDGETYKVSGITTKEKV